MPSPTGETTIWLPILGPHHGHVHAHGDIDNTRSIGSNMAGSIVGTSITDVDAGSVQGIAVVGLTGTADGDWQYLAAAGNQWTMFGAVSETAADCCADAIESVLSRTRTSMAP